MIFGNTSPQPTPLIFGTKGGIPILSDYQRGYFNKNGNFKRYNIAVDLTAELSSTEVFSAAFKGQLQILEVLSDSSVIIKKGGEVIKELSLINFIWDVKKKFS